MKLQVMICTHGPEGLDRVSAMSLPLVQGVAYLVSCQSAPRAVPEALRRPDVRVVFTSTTGLSHNRNNAIEHLEAPYALIADDDVHYRPEGLRAIIAAFDSDAELDLAAFRCEMPTPRAYPPAGCLIADAPRGYMPISIEIALRVSMLRRYPRLRFSPLLGLGAPYLNCGEEDVFFNRCRRKARKAMFVNEVIAAHPHLSTGERLRTQPATIRSKGAIIACLLPATCVLRLPLEAWRLPGNKARNLLYLCQGALYGFRHRHEIMHNA